MDYHGPRDQTTPFHDSNHATARSAIGPASFLDAGKPLVDHARIDESCLQQGCNEVAILLPERAELGDTEIFLVQTPTGELRLSGRRRRVGVLHLSPTNRATDP
jgi:hypothetical protein